MAVRDYWIRFGSGNPSSTSGLAPTFITFINNAGTPITAPSITEPGTKGLYYFAYDATQTIAFTCDGATTGLATSDRYVVGVLDPQDMFGVTLNSMSATLSVIGASLVNHYATFGAMNATFVAMNTTMISIGASLGNFYSTFSAFQSTFADIDARIGSTASSYGSTSADPGSLFGYLKRIQELNEGNQKFTKATGILQLFSRGSGTTTLLRQLTVTDSVTLTVKE